MTSALEIYQRVLDHTTEAVWDRRFEDLADALIYPHQIATEDRLADVPDRETLIAFARSFRENMEQLGATAYFRVAREAAYVGKDHTRIEGRHTGYVLQGATPVVAPFDSEMTILFEAGRWRGAGIASKIRNADIRINARVKDMPKDMRDECDPPSEHSPPAKSGT